MRSVVWLFVRDFSRDLVVCLEWPIRGYFNCGSGWLVCFAVLADLCTGAERAEKEAFGAGAFSGRRLAGAPVTGRALSPRASVAPTDIPLLVAPFAVFLPGFPRRFDLFKDGEFTIAGLSNRLCEGVSSYVKLGAVFGGWRWVQMRSEIRRLRTRIASLWVFPRVMSFW